MDLLRLENAKEELCELLDTEELLELLEELELLTLEDEYELLSDRSANEKGENHG